jgi:hypothetical protein
MLHPEACDSHLSKWVEDCAEAMRKLGARNTADLVRLALLHPAG